MGAKSKLQVQKIKGGRLLPMLTRAYRGFALVVTLALMILLTLVAVGLLSLSAISLRSSAQATAQSEARANARLALMIAIGELQKQMGPDQRISAKGSILDQDPQTAQMEQVKHPHWTGVWDSWIAGPRAMAAVNSDYPSADSHHQTIGNQPDNSMRPEYAQKDKHFREWLVSLLPQDADQIASAKNLVLDGKEFPGKTDTSIRLVGSGSSSSTDYVSARLIDATSPTGGKGRYGWWVGDESQKARVMHDSYVSTPPANSAEKIYRGQSPDSTGTKKIKDLEDLTAAQDLKLDGLPSMKTLDLVTGNASKQPVRKNFHHITPYSSQVLADVREGGLKRDLSTILEQPIVRTNTGPQYMLYEFDDPRFPNDRSHSRVPIQDLAAYYQLYDHEPTFNNQRREGVHYTSAGLSNAIQLRTPDHDGNAKDRQKILREYTSLYKQPVITKVQFLLAVGAEPVTAAERQNILNAANNPTPGSRVVPMRDTDTHKLRLGMTTMVTFWNPNNIPLVMDAHQILRFSTPPFGIRWRKYRSGGGFYDYRWSNLSYAAGNAAGGAAAGQNSGFCLLRLSFAKNAAQRVVFEPGEVKVFSLPSTAGGTLTKAGNAVPMVSEGTNMDTFNGWDPFGFFLMPNSTPQGPYGDEAPEAYDFDYTNGKNAECMAFNPDDSISLSIDTENPAAAMAGNWRDGRLIAGANEIKGAGFNLYMLDEGYQKNWQDAIDFLRHYTMISRHGNSDAAVKGRISTFYKELMTPGFPGGVAPIDFTTSTNAIPVSQIIGASAAGEVISIMEFSLSIGCESGASSSGGFGGGRRITSRPFLHSATSAGPFIDQNDKKSLYNYGWDWQLGKVNNIEDSIVTAKPGSGNGYYGGGYTIENGTTHVVQREIPVLPVISIASLSHAHLGGFSLGYANIAGDDPDNDKLWFKSSRIVNPIGVDYQKTGATGQGGLAPHIVQAAGNSYAHPNIPANKAFTTWTRLFDEDAGEGSKVVPFVDHSYLVNKALWDEFYFSSIAPQPSKVPLFGGTNRTAKQVADEFFKLSNPQTSSPLPNRRIKPYHTSLDQPKLDSLFTQASVYTNGLADKIAAHLMVEGAFNINSTSEDAWRVFLTSLKGKPMAYLDGGAAPKEVTPVGTTISSSSLPNGAPVKSAEITDINDPINQWKSGRELTDDEIDQLAIAMVKQVKLRGPFLSMSEFINRRLEGDGNPGASARSSKGALQAALDDPAVTINASFRTPIRLLDSETAGSPFAFPDAAKGPIAYGSMAYVDQADVLRGFAEQLTPRGDTFIIRTYGDSINASGEVVARAWCEAVVQRVPEYVNAADEPHLKQADPALSTQSRQFGRKIQIVGFRWINASEV